MKKYRFNSDKLFRNFTILSAIVTTGILVYKIATCGIAWVSTIGYFG